MTTYRDAPCETCAARDQMAKEMLPFARRGNRACPACKTDSHWMFQKICRGSGTYVVRNGFWIFRWWNRVTFTCDRGPAPPHFHLVCNVCLYHWEMLTALDQPSVEGS